MVKVVTEEIRREVVAVTSRKRVDNISTLSGELSLERLHGFSWSGVCSEAELKIPSLVAVLDATLPSASKIARSVVVGPKNNKR